MPRISKEQDYYERRNEILDAAQRLIYSKGFETMTIQDILDDLKISKGAFYHYFRSKHALLEGLIDRSIQNALVLVKPILDDPNLSSLQKLARYFDAVASWKLAQKDYMLQLLRVWYKDENSLLRQKMTSAGNEFLSPHLSKLIEQGLREGLMKVNDPEMSAKVVYSLMLSLGDELGRTILDADNSHPDTKREQYAKSMIATTRAFTDAIECILGVPNGSIILIQEPMLKQWILP
jgi:AcrR family transcriptional regulator